MKTKFTPGPWKRNKFGFIYADDGAEHIVKVDSSFVDALRKQSEAKAPRNKAR